MRSPMLAVAAALALVAGAAALSRRPEEEEEDVSTGRLDPSWDDAHPDLADKGQRVVAAMKARGHDPYLYEVWRTADRGAYLKSIGNSEAGANTLHNATDDDGERASRAVDIVDGSYLHGHMVWWGASLPEWGLTEEQEQEREDKARAFFDDLEAEAEAVGLNTISWDRAHLELP